MRAATAASLPSTATDHMDGDRGDSPKSGGGVGTTCSPLGIVVNTIPGTGVPTMGNVGVVTAVDVDTVAVTSADALPLDKVKQISWHLEARREQLVLPPAPSTSPGRARTPARWLAYPSSTSRPRASARGSASPNTRSTLPARACGSILISPLMIFLATVVRLTSQDPVFFRQTRVGYRGREFMRFRFRSIVVNAEDMLQQLGKQQRDSGNEVLFKMENDPLVTPVGRVMRNFSNEEPPQLFNVLGGSMSLVGPLAALPKGVEQYADHVHRRFRAKPGITGLGQESGRSSLRWEDTVRLDLDYVENWSLLGACVILAKTARAALAPGETAS